MRESLRAYVALSFLDLAVANLFDWAADAEACLEFDALLAKFATEKREWFAQNPRMNTDELGRIVDFGGAAVSAFRRWELHHLAEFAEIVCTADEMTRGKKGVETHRCFRYFTHGGFRTSLENLVGFRNTVMHCRVLQPGTANEVVPKTTKAFGQLYQYLRPILGEYPELACASITENELQTIIGEALRETSGLPTPEGLVRCWFPGDTDWDYAAAGLSWPSGDRPRYVSVKPVTVGEASMALRAGQLAQGCRADEALTLDHLEALAKAHEMDDGTFRQVVCKRLQPRASHRGLRLVGWSAWVPRAGVCATRCRNWWVENRSRAAWFVFE